MYLAVVPLAAFEILLRASFPGFPDLVHDWANFSHWFLIFIAGFLLASSQPLLDRTQHLRGMSLALASCATALMFLQFWSPEQGGFFPSVNGETDTWIYVWFCVLRVSNAWFWLLTCLGYAGRYLQRPSRLLGYLNNAVYPLFCLHLTVIVALEYVIVPLNWSVLAKYLVITTGTIFVTLGSYELLWRRIAFLRPLVGLKHQRNNRSRSAAACRDHDTRPSASGRKQTS